MAFEVFTETGARTQEFISITGTKTFGVPRAFLDKRGITSEHKAVILYDAEENKIALHFSDKDPRVGFAVRVTGPKQGAIIAARSFFDIKSVDVEKYAGRYDFEKKTLSDLGIDKPGDAYVITLKEKDQKKPVDQSKAEPMQGIGDDLELNEFLGGGNV